MFVTLTPLIQVLAIIIGLYKTIQLFVCRRERIMLIDKLEKLDGKSLGNLNLLHNKPTKSWPLHISLLLAGVGLGILVALTLQYVTSGTFTSPKVEGDPYYAMREMDMLYTSCVCLFGGLGLFLSYLIEQKNNRKQSSHEAEDND